MSLSTGPAEQPGAQGAGALSLGPVELLVVEFPGSQFKGEIAPALKELVDTGLIRIIDLLVVRKDADGTVTFFEEDALDLDTFAAIDPLVSELLGLISEDDAQRLGALLEPNSSAGVLLFENTWATRFRDSLVRANGRLVLNERIPRSVIAEAMAYQAITYQENVSGETGTAAQESQH